MFVLFQTIEIKVLHSIFTKIKIYLFVFDVERKAML
jgi:hypothetical protein